MDGVDDEDQEGNDPDGDDDTNTEHSDQQGKDSLASVCALGSQDRGLSIWVTRRSRPLLVARDVFDNNVYDLAW
jgi:protein HIRA/HIR1